MMKLQKAHVWVVLLIAVIVTLDGAPTAAAVRFSVTEIPVMATYWKGESSTAYAISSNGIVAGEAAAVATDSFLANHGFRYQDGAMTDLGIFPQVAPYSRALGVNASGSAVGEVWNAGGSHAFTHQNGQLIDLGTFGGAFTRAADINDSGVIVGYSDVAGASRMAFRYANGQMTPLGTLPGGVSSSALAINASGQIAGWSYVNGNGHAFILDSLGMRELAPSWASSNVEDINDAGIAVGIVAAATGPTRSAIFDGSSVMLLSSILTYPRAINNHFQIVGDAGDFSTSSAYFWENGVVTDLDTLLPPGSGWDLIRAHDINDAGQIVGMGRHEGKTRGFVLTPVPEPGILMIMVPMSALALRLRYRRRTCW
jgi:probable HAF family extracellular repeat protein